MSIAQKQRMDAEYPVTDLGSAILRTLTEEQDRSAFRYRGSSLTRGAILRAARATAVNLANSGVEPGAPVAILIEHSFELVVGVCAVLLAGGCAVPIDPNISVERRRAIFDDIHSKILLTRSECVAEGDETMQHLTVSLNASEATDRDEICTPARIDPKSDLAFIVYTSGTSGGPKGVEITHANYVERLQQIVAISSLEKDDVDLLWTPSSFIGMLDEIFYPLFTGMPAVIAETEARTDARAFGKLVQRESVTRFRITPSLLKAFLDAGIHTHLGSVRAIYSSGEKVSADLQRKVHSLMTADLIGFYGATEAPGVAFHTFDRNAPPLQSTICTPQPFALIRVTREGGSEAEPGEVGEIWISSCAVARGYWRKPALTAEKFVSSDGRRWYRTGDRGLRLEGDRVEIIDRVDMSEVNLHGVRINIPEIREALCALRGVDDAWVSVIAIDDGIAPVLVGHYLPAKDAKIDPASARTELASRLPTLAVPRFLLEVESFPLTANGKLDAQRLARDAADHVSSPRRSTADAGQSSTGSATEIAVLNCFEQALNRRRLPLNEGFFDAGGTSLEAVTLACLISDHFRTEIGFEDIWMHPTVLELAAHIERRGAGRTARTFFHVEGASGPNLFAIGFGVSHLSGLWPNRRLFVNPGISGDPRVSLRKRLSDYVSEYVHGVRLVQPKGPYQFIGFSFSGLLAYEIARQLHTEGEKITGLALIEPVTPMGARPNRAYGRVAIRQVAKAAAARKLKRSRNLLRLIKNSVAASNVRPEWRQLSAYGEVVAEAECLQPCPLPVDLIYCDACPEQALVKWKSSELSDVRLCKVTAKNHQSLIKPESTRQWKTVIDQWVT